MKKVILKRFKFSENSCIGKVEICKGDEVLYSCFSLENPKEGAGANQDLRIPAGIYEFVFQPSSMSGAKENKGFLPLIYNEVVPKSRLIRIHAGNTEKDTLGCILLGKSHKKDFISSSKLALKEFLSFFDLSEKIKLEIHNLQEEDKNV